jgi:hypothetical protein
MDGCDFIWKEREHPVHRVGYPFLLIHHHHSSCLKNLKNKINK